MQQFPPPETRAAAILYWAPICAQGGEHASDRRRGRNLAAGRPDGGSRVHLGLQQVLESPAFRCAQISHRLKSAPFGGEFQQSACAMHSNSGTGQSLELSRRSAPFCLPLTAVRRSDANGPGRRCFKGQLMRPSGCAERQSARGTAGTGRPFFIGVPREQPKFGAQTGRWTRQAQQGPGVAGGRQDSGHSAPIHQQKTVRLGQQRGRSAPAESTPTCSRVRSLSGARGHGVAAITATSGRSAGGPNRPGGGRRLEGFCPAHRMARQGAAAGQQPADG